MTQFPQSIEFLLSGYAPFIRDFEFCFILADENLLLGFLTIIYSTLEYCKLIHLYSNPIKYSDFPECMKTNCRTKQSNHQTMNLVLPITCDPGDQCERTSSTFVGRSSQVRGQHMWWTGKSFLLNSIVQTHRSLPGSLNYRFHVSRWIYGEMCMKLYPRRLFVGIKKMMAFIYIVKLTHNNVAVMDLI